MNTSYLEFEITAEGRFDLLQIAFDALKGAKQSGEFPPDVQWLGSVDIEDDESLEEEDD